MDILQVRFMRQGVLCFALPLRNVLPLSEKQNSCQILDIL